MLIVTLERLFEVCEAAPRSPDVPQQQDSFCAA